MLNSQARSFLDRVKVGVSSSIDLTRLAYWIEKNTTHPKDNTKPWSFAGHEFQKAILNDPAARVVVRKCSQVGVSELSVRMTLALLATLRNHTAIYTLPTSSFAATFSKTRFDPVVQNSTVLNDMLNRNLDNVAVKQLGSSFLYVLGTFTQKAAISIPSDILINDEVDFSNQQALTTFSSRLGHAEKRGNSRGLRREFSTPTCSGFGISKSFETSSQAAYGVECNHCYSTVFPQFMEDVRVPGFEGLMDEFEREDLLDFRYKVSEAFVECPECHQPIDPTAFLNPEKRQWVHKFPTREVKGYQVFPYDAPSADIFSETLYELANYDRKSDWINFKVGLPAEDAESSFLRDVLNNHKTVAPLQPPSGSDGADLSKYRHKGLVMGVDIGKISWVLVGKPTERSKIDIVWAERIRQDGDGALLARLCFLVKWFGVTKAVVDAGPDFTTSMGFVSAFPLGRTYANYYVRAKSKGTLSHLLVKEEEGIINTVRTESFDIAARQVNAGRFSLPKMGETEAVIEHLGNLKRISTKNNQGEVTPSWTSTGADHYGHALNYLNIAATLLDKRFSVPGVQGVLPMAAKVKVKTK